MADDQSRRSADNPFGIPGFDLSRMLETFQVPGLDLQALLERERRNIEAVRQANEAVAEGWQKLATRQAEIFRESMTQWQEAMSRNQTDKQPSPEDQAELMRKGFEQALDNMRELAEIAAESQARAYEIMRERLEQNISEFFERGTRQNE